MQQIDLKRKANCPVRQYTRCLVFCVKTLSYCLWKNFEIFAELLSCLNYEITGVNKGKVRSSPEGRPKLAERIGWHLLEYWLQLCITVTASRPIVNYTYVLLHWAYGTTWFLASVNDLNGVDHISTRYPFFYFAPPPSFFSSRAADTYPKSSSRAPRSQEPSAIPGNPSNFTFYP